MASETIAAREGWILQSNRDGSWSIWAKGDGSATGGPCLIHGNGIGDALRFIEGWRAARPGDNEVAGFPDSWLVSMDV